MKRIILAAALVGLSTSAAGAAPVRLDEARLQEVTAGVASPIGINVNILTPVNVSNLIGVDNTVDVTNQIGNAFAIGVVNAVSAFADGVTAIGGVTAGLGLVLPGSSVSPAP